MSALWLFNAKWHALRMITIGAPFTIMGILYILQKEQSIGELILLILSTLLFGSVMLFGIFRLLDRRPQLILTQEIFQARQLPLPPVRWEQIKDAHIYVMRRGVVFLSLKLDKTYVFPVKEYAWASFIRRRVGSHRYSVPLSNIKVDADQLCKLVLQMAASNASDREALLAAFGYGKFTFSSPPSQSSSRPL